MPERSGLGGPSRQRSVSTRRGKKGCRGSNGAIPQRTPITGVRMASAGISDDHQGLCFAVFNEDRYFDVLVGCGKAAPSTCQNTTSTDPCPFR